MITLALLALPLLQSAPERSSAAPRRTVLPAEPVVMPIDTATGRPVVEVMIGGRGPFPMILDTGAMRTVLYADLAAELELEVTGQSRIGDPSNPEANVVDVVAVPVLQVGDATFEEIEAVAWELPPGMSLPGTRGVLGIPTFSDCLLTIDYSGRSIRIEKGALPEADGRGVIDLLNERGRLLTIPLDVEGEVVDTHLDTGNPSGVVLPKRLEEKLSLVEGTATQGRGMRASGPVEFTGGVLDGSLSVGGFVMERPNVRFDSALETGNLGAEFFAQCIVTLDQANGRVRIASLAEPVQANSRKVVDKSGKRRLGASMMPSDGKLVVVAVAPGSLGERAGLQAGDVLLEVGGTAVTFSDAAALTEALNADDAFTLTVRRDGERVELEVPAGN